MAEEENKDGAQQGPGAQMPKAEPTPENAAERTPETEPKSGEAPAPATIAELAIASEPKSGEAPGAAKAAEPAPASESKSGEAPAAVTASESGPASEPKSGEAPAAKDESKRAKRARLKSAGADKGRRKSRAGDSDGSPAASASTPVSSAPLSSTLAASSPAPSTPAAVKGRRRDRRVVAGAVATSLAGVLTLALLGGAGAFGTWVQPEAPAGDFDAVAARVPAGESVSVCPAPLRLLSGAGDGTDAQFRPESSDSSLNMRSIALSDPNGRLPGSAIESLDGKVLKQLSKTAAPLDGEAAALPDQKAVAESSRAVTDTQLLRVGTMDGKETVGGASLAYLAEDGDLRGLASASCLTPSSDQWLVGAATTVGRTAVLNLSNPSGTPATVNIELFGAEGQIKAPGSRGLTVAPGKTRSIVLAGLAPNQERLALHVTSAGGAVAASVQQNVLRGLTPGGVDILTPVAAPALQQVVTGVVLADPKGYRNLGPGFEDAVPTLQIAAPGAQDASVSVKVFSQSGQQVFSSGGVLTVKGGSVADLPLTSLPAGDYSIWIQSDTSVTAAARISRVRDSKDPMDFAWANASTPIGTSQLFPVPSGGGLSIVLGAPRGDANVSYRPVTENGKVGAASTVELKGSRTQVVRFPDSLGGSPVVGYLLSSSGEQAYVAAVQTQKEGSGVTVVQAPRGNSGIEQLPVRSGL